jgi:hypothetical protein
VGNNIHSILEEKKKDSLMIEGELHQWKYVVEESVTEKKFYWKWNGSSTVAPLRSSLIPF